LYSPFVDINTIFRKGDNILILILHSLRDLGWHRVKHHCSLLSLAPITFDANTFSCYGGSYFATIAVIYRLSKTSKLGRDINAHIIVVAYYRDHCLLFRVCSFAELSSTFIITTPEGVAVVYTNTSVILFFQSYINISMGHARLVCTQFSLFCTTFRRSGSTVSLFLQRIALNDPTISLPYNNILSRRNIDGFHLYVCS
jgi:hypothetical protein